MERFKAIVFGYPCIGKSTLAKNDSNFVDLESSVFKYPNGERDQNWYIVYSEMAIHIARQNRIVLMSTHPWTRDYIYNKKLNHELDDLDDIIIVYPSLDLEGDFKEKALRRYEEDPSDKNIKAFSKISKDFKDDINALYNDKRFIRVELNNIEQDGNHRFHRYDLRNVIYSQIAVDVQYYKGRKQFDFSGYNLVGGK